MFRKLSYLTVAALVAAFASLATADIQSGTPTFDWMNPSVWSDGTPLTAAQITGYQLECVGAATTSRRIAAAPGVPPSLTDPANRFAPGSHTCTLQIYGKYTPSSPEILGAKSNSTSFTVPQPTLGAPQGFSAN